MIQQKFDKNKLYNSLDIQRKNNDTLRTGTPSRDDFERDYSRIVHSAAFRRLQSKTQVFGIGEGDFHRTRLTHSMEVSQIARGIVLALNHKDKLLSAEEAKIDSSLIEAAALAHDFGHPPFGHQGERALNKQMLEHDSEGFEGNAQTFRILTRLERGQGLNLTRATLMAILKYPILYKDALNKNIDSNNPPKTSIYENDKGYFDWILESLNEKEKFYYQEFDSNYYKDKHNQTNNKTLECSIIELADDIAYATHDLEDTLRLNLVDLTSVIKILNDYKHDSYPAICSAIEKLENKKDLHFSQTIKDAIADIITTLISNVMLKENGCFISYRIKYRATLPKELQSLIKELTQFVKKNVIDDQKVQTIEWKGGFLVKQLFKAFYNESKLLPQKERDLIDTEYNKARVICDYISGMTDSYAIKMYSRLYETKESRLFDI